MNENIGELCTFNRGELKGFDNDVCIIKDRIEFTKEDGEEVTIEVKNSFFDKIRRNLLLDFVNFRYLLYDEEEWINDKWKSE